ncbi:serine/threonine-protein kinase [bacterium]|nr:serine/threonine-protein kinase [bacterium]
MSLKNGSQLRDRYRIIERLAQSGMGTVYKAYDEVLNVDVAIKENQYTTEGHSRQFRQEATILAKLRHPNLPRVIDHFVLEDQGEYLVMDFIEGLDLDQRLTELGGPLPEDQAVRIGAVVCDALDYLHSRTPPVIHRDIKPGNLKITPEGQVMLVDFGLAKFFEQGEMTAIGAKGITPGFSPVEQYGEGTDARSDVYALGATLYALLTGQTPPESLDRAIGRSELTPIADLNPAVSPELAEVVEKGMAVRAEDRYPTVAEFKQALLAAHPLPGNASEQSITGSTRPQTKPQTQTQTPPAPRKKRSVWAWLIPVLVIVLGGGAAAIFLLRGGGPAAPADPPTPTETSAVAVAEADPTASPTTAPLPTETEAAAAVEPTPTLTPEPEGTPQGGGRGQIAFVSERDGLPQVYLMKADGSDVQQLTTEMGGACQPAWAPDGLSLAYISPCDGPKERYDRASLFVLNLETGRSDLISTLATGDYDPAWSPDGTTLAFTSLQTGKPQIFVYDLDSGETRNLMNRSTISRMPAWSPDGSQLLFVSPSPVTNRPVLFTVDADGTGEPRAVLAQNAQTSLRPAWSPEGNLVLFDLGKEGELGGRLLGANQDVPVDTGLALAQNPAFSPDADWILCDGREAGADLEIYIMMRSGARLTALTDNEGDDYQPAWRP